MFLLPFLILYIGMMCFYNETRDHGSDLWGIGVLWPWIAKYKEKDVAGPLD